MQGRAQVEAVAEVLGLELEQVQLPLLLGTVPYLYPFCPYLFLVARAAPFRLPVLAGQVE